METHELLDLLLKTVKFSQEILDKNNITKPDQSKFFSLLYEGIEEIERKIN